MLMSKKRTDEIAFTKVQAGNEAWWTTNPMTYDWRGEDSRRPSPEWFDAMDNRFIAAAQLFAHDSSPFDRLIPYDALKGKRVLEIGCGMGLHTELMLKAGAEVVSVDLSETSVKMTKLRLAYRHLQGDVRRCDAESLPFDPGTFDFVWSWGVIHHSSRTGRIVREIARVLKSTGEARVMVYNRDGMPAWITFWTRYVARLGFRKRSFDELLFQSTDGFMARFYTRDQLEDLFRTFFEDVSTIVCGQEPDAIPLPRHFRKPLRKVVSRNWMEQRQAKRGSFLFLTARTPV